MALDLWLFKPLLKCPKCGHNKVNVSIWGGASYDGKHLHYKKQDMNIDEKDVFICEACFYEGDDSTFRVKEKMND